MINLLRTHMALGNIAAASPHLKLELEQMISSEFFVCSDWAPFKWKLFCLRTVSRIGGFVFVGSDISRQEEQTTISFNFAMYVFITGAKLQLFPQ